MSITCPADFSDADQEHAARIVPDGSFVTQMMTVITWMGEDGESYWRCYCATGQGERIATSIGLLEIAKLDIISRTDTGLPIRYPELDDE